MNASATPSALPRDDPSTRHPQKGAVLLAVVVLVAVAATMSAAVLERAFSTAAELRARRDVLCARYAALGGLALGATFEGDGAAALVGPGVRSLAVARVKLAPSWCVLRASASCGGALRTVDRTLADASACSAAPP